MRIKELETRSGLTRDALRYYERIGLISAPRRHANGYRDYDPHTLVELRFIRAAREIGFALEEIKDAIPSLRSPPERCERLLAKLRARRDAIQQDIALHLRRRKRIDGLILRFEGRGRR